MFVINKANIKVVGRNLEGTMEGNEANFWRRKNLKLSLTSMLKLLDYLSFKVDLVIFTVILELPWQQRCKM